MVCRYSENPWEGARYQVSVKIGGSRGSSSIYLQELGTLNVMINDPSKSTARYVIGHPKDL